MPVPVTALGPSWLDPDQLISTFGLIGMLIIVFAECGLLVGFFLPGDSLLFTAGLLVADDNDHPAVVAGLRPDLRRGDRRQPGRLHDRPQGRTGVFSRPDSRLFKQEYVDKTYAFFDKYGPRAIVLARFVPIVRTFITVIAGVGQDGLPHLHDVLGDRRRAVGRWRHRCWATALGDVDFVRDHIELILLGIVAVSLIPIAFELLRARSRSRDRRYDEPAERARVEQEKLHPEG